MSYVFIPNEDFLLCPICNLVGKKDCLSLHLINLHQWSNVEIQSWLFAIHNK